VTIQRNEKSRKARATGNARQKHHRPPWGGLLGGKSIERHAWVFGEKTDLGEEFARQMQYFRMLKLKEYYRITGGEYGYPYPIKGIGRAEWLPWYELALSIASALDDSFKIIDADPPKKTAKRWRGGFDGTMLLELVDQLHTFFRNRSVRWCLHQLQSQNPGLKQIPLKQLVVRYHEAKRHQNATKRRRHRSSETDRAARSIPPKPPWASTIAVISSRVSRCCFGDMAASCARAATANVSHRLTHRYKPPPLRIGSSAERSE
jgi:hypothetical protein